MSQTCKNRSRYNGRRAVLDMVMFYSFIRRCNCKTP
ncbi:hypothetical protein BofuT4_P129930.1 [Botrytis cinerea T4]|uniref:Uncharacterized protein n=1 Tax=Botryotinia fuckeliana (strain T4) TaxID=999810 RepID=G2YRP5_BOTF4|nr:hypothetical protein BofuT4_P129930.1 [Botrytis cinerea T4]